MRELHAKVREIFPFSVSAPPAGSGKCHGIEYAQPPLAHEFHQTTMKPRFSHQRNCALTRTDVLAVLVVSCLLVIYFLYALTAAYSPRRPISCISQLKQIGIAFRLWEGDNNGKYPMAVSVTNGGVMELVATGNVVACFQAMSNELSTPKILLCPEDTHRVWATNFSALKNSNISYFLGVDVADDANPNLFLSGDDNFAISGVPVKSGILPLFTNAPVTWTRARHKYVGHIGMADGSAQQVTTSWLKKALTETGIATNRLAIP
jgi:hypothetical protein